MTAERISSDRGQSTVEWVALALLVAAAIAVMAAVVGVGIPGAALARAIAAKLACAARITDSCTAGATGLAAAYGDELAALVTEHAPELRYEQGMRALPVDYRRCREDGCAEGAETGEIWRSRSGEPAVAFIHAIDCRAGSVTAAGPQEADCSGARAGNLYLQYWFYYPGSATAEGGGVIGPAIRELSSALGRPTYHPDDWESLQLRIDRHGYAWARASSHHWYSYELGGERGWGPSLGSVYVSGGSHAGNVLAPRDSDRITPASQLRLIALEPVAAGERRRFAITPPWRKRVWFDPEYEGTD
ncbi:MAG TPA: hypothetical protein VFY37_01000 [Solirubrobacterales bacterium]|nr:hypothetical protein [Solirubrobacterales bacterium]